MANQTPYADNVSGKYYVDYDCIDCGLCSEIASQNFRHSLNQDHDMVYKQPTNPEEENACQEAYDSCPVEAIGNDGI